MRGDRALAEFAGPQQSVFTLICVISTPFRSSFYSKRDMQGAYPIPKISCAIWLVTSANSSCGRDVRRRLIPMAKGFLYFTAVIMHEVGKRFFWLRAERASKHLSSLCFAPMAVAPCLVYLWQTYACWRACCPFCQPKGPRCSGAPYWCEFSLVNGEHIPF